MIKAKTSAADEVRDLLVQYAALPEGTERAALEREIVTRNIPLAKRLAHRYVQGGRKGTTEDMLQSATLGLYDAVRKFDPAKGYAFSSYAAQWIRHRVNEEVNRSSYKSKNRKETMPAPIAKAYREFVHLKGYQPTHEDLGCTQDQFSTWMNPTWISPEDLSGTHSGADNEDYNPTNDIRFSTEDYEGVRKLMLMEAVEEAKRELSPRIQKILELSIEGKTTREIGAIFNLHYSWICRCLEKAHADVKDALYRKDFGPEDLNENASGF